jgi:hypothetical protein
VPRVNESARLTAVGLWKAGVVLACVALAMWGVVIALLVTDDPANGADIGAGGLAFVGMALSVVAESFLIASTDRKPWKTVGAVAICAWALASVAPGTVYSLANLALGLLGVALHVVCLVLLWRGWRSAGSAIRSP